MVRSSIAWSDLALTWHESVIYRALNGGRLGLGYAFSNGLGLLFFAHGIIHEGSPDALSLVCGA